MNKNSTHARIVGTNSKTHIVLDPDQGNPKSFLNKSYLVNQYGSQISALIILTICGFMISGLLWESNALLTPNEFRVIDLNMLFINITAIAIAYCSFVIPEITKWIETSSWSFSQECESNIQKGLSLILLIGVVLQLGMIIFNISIIIKIFDFWMMIKNSHLISIYVFSCLLFNIEYIGFFSGTALILISWISEIASSAVLERMIIDMDSLYVLKALFLQLLSIMMKVKSGSYASSFIGYVVWTGMLQKSSFYLICLLNKPSFPFNPSLSIFMSFILSYRIICSSCMNYGLNDPKKDWNKILFARKTQKAKVWLLSYKLC